MNPPPADSIHHVLGPVEVFLNQSPFVDASYAVHLLRAGGAITADQSDCRAGGENARETKKPMRFQLGRCEGEPGN